MKLPFFGNGANGKKNEQQEPQLRPGSSQGLSPLQSAGSSGTYTATPAPALAPGPAQPTPASAFPQLAAMSIADLEKAVLDQVAFEKLVAKIAAEAQQPGAGPSAAGVGGVMAEVAALRRGNAELAHANLAVEGQMDEVRRQIAIIRSTEYDAARAAFDEKSRRQDAAREVLAPERLIERLKDAADAALSEGVALEKSFLAGEIQDAGQFVEQFTSARVRYHSRDMKYQAARQTIPTSGLPTGTPVPR